MTGIIIDFNLPYFREAFPEFGNSTTYPDTMLQRYWDWATYYITNVNAGPLYNLYSPPPSPPVGSPPGFARTHAIDLMTAHLLLIHVQAAAGEIPGIAQEATIDKVNVAIVPPPIPNQWQYWLQTTPYGQALLALLQVRSSGGFYVGGLGAQAAFGIGQRGYGPWYGN